MKIWLILLLLLTTISVTAGAYNEDTVVLLHGGANYSGIVELHQPGKSGKWGTVCSDDWDDRDARVACRQFANFSDGLAYKHYPEVHTQGHPFITSKYHCRGNESRLSDCPHVKLHHDVECRSGHYPGVLCSTDGNNEQPPTAAVDMAIVVGSVSAAVIGPAVLTLIVLMLLALYKKKLCTPLHLRHTFRRKRLTEKDVHKLPAIGPGQLRITMDPVY